MAVPPIKYYKFTKRWFWMFGSGPVSRYQIMLAFEPHYTVWKYIRNHFARYNWELSNLDIQRALRLSPQFTDVVLYELEESGSIYRRPGLEHLHIYIAKDEFRFPRRRRFENVRGIHAEIKARSSFDIKKRKLRVMRSVK